MKKSLTIVALSSFTFSLSQVGVNTETPKTTLDVSAKRDSFGTITDNAQFYGLQAPRLTRAELTSLTSAYGTDQKGALIYITDVSGGNASFPRTNIDAVGYYYFDGSLWQKMSGGTASLGDLRMVGSNNHVTQDAGQNSTGTTTGTGYSNIFIGQGSGDSALLSAHQNIFIGDYAGAYSKTHSAVVIGYAAGQSLGGAASAPDEAAVIIGKAAGLNLDSVDTDGASHTVMIGDNAGSNAGSFLNGVILGSEAGLNSNNNNGNVYIGKQAGYQDTNSSDNVLIGNKAGYDNIGSSNISIGASAGYSSHGNDNILIGKLAGSTLNANNNIIIGNNVAAANNTGNQLNIGNWIYGNNGSIGIGTSSPDTSAKLDVTASNKGFLPPRVNLTSNIMDLDGTAGQATGLLVFNTGASGNLTQGYYYWDGTQWKSVGLGGAVYQNITFVTGSRTSTAQAYTIDDDDYYVFLRLSATVNSANVTTAINNATAPAYDITLYNIKLPDPTTCPGREIHFINDSDGVNSGPAGGGVIAYTNYPIYGTYLDGVSTNYSNNSTSFYEIRSVYPKVKIVSDGTRWIAVQITIV
ncbi:MAG: hypothetical protein GXO46_06640 [Chlorobi bacterium]|jgi:hypothetical protein|uniref:hypothetical protein n=1 Tax=Chryseobacterium sp. VD8 TaxID=3081254 RepID=UPI00245161CC|nr:hypothetical protein [Chlorobiota bacterium]